jgi:hypothetical protein
MESQGIQMIMEENSVMQSNENGLVNNLSNESGDGNRSAD